MEVTVQTCKGRPGNIEKKEILSYDNSSQPLGLTNNPSK